MSIKTRVRAIEKKENINKQDSNVLAYYLSDGLFNTDKLRLVSKEQKETFYSYLNERKNELS